MLRTQRLALAICGMILPFYAAHAEGAKIAVVSTQTITKESAAFKSIMEQIETKKKSYQGDITKEDESLQKQKQELEKQQSALAKDVFENKVKEFQSKAVAFQGQVRTKKAILDNAYQQSISQFQKTLAETVADVAKDKGLSLVISNEQLMYSESSLDITADVTKRLNEKMPSYTVKFEAPAAPKAPEKKK